jgi:hypothetical protein
MPASTIQLLLLPFQFERPETHQHRYIRFVSNPAIGNITLLRRYYSASPFEEQPLIHGNRWIGLLHAFYIDG